MKKQETIVQDEIKSLKLKLAKIMKERKHLRAVCSRRWDMLNRAGLYVPGGFVLYNELRDELDSGSVPTMEARR